MSEITILGANGWIGSALAHFCEHKKYHKVHRVGRRDLTEWMSSASVKAQDTVFYCIGRKASCVLFSYISFFFASRD